MESLLYLGIMLVVICVWFLAFKRPVYEAVLLAFVVLNIPAYLLLGLFVIARGRYLKGGR